MGLDLDGVWVRLGWDQVGVTLKWDQDGMGSGWWGVIRKVECVFGQDGVELGWCGPGWPRSSDWVGSG